MKRPRNPLRRAAFTWLFLAIIPAAVAVLPYLTNLNWIGLGVGASCIAGMFTVICTIASIALFVRASSLEKILQGEGLLAHWTYTPEEWAQYSKAEFMEDRAEKARLLLMIGGVAAFVGVVFLISNPESSKLILGILVGIVVLLGGLAFAIPRLNYVRSQKSREAYVSETGVYINGVLHNWDILGSKLESITLLIDPAKILEVQYSIPTRRGRQQVTLHVPIPGGQEETAMRVISQLQHRS